MADLLSSLIEILAPSAMAGPPVPNVMPPEGPNVQPVQSPRFGIGGQLGQLPQPANVRPAPPPGFSVGTGALPVADEMLKMFAPPAPTAAPMPMPVPRAPSQGAALPPMPPQQQQDNAGITGADVQRFIRSVATGAGRADPRAPGAAAFAQGAMGSLQNSYQEGERERAVRLNERRADTALSLQEQRDRRAEQEYKRKVARDEAIDRERQVRISERLEKIAALKDPRVRHQDIKAFNEEMRGKAKLLQMQVREGSLTPEKAESLLEEHRRNVIEQYATRNPGAKAPPAAGAPQGQPNPGAVYEYQGKRYRYNNGNWEPVQ